MKKIIAGLSLVLICSSLIAAPNRVRFNPEDQSRKFEWLFKSIDDGIIFLLDPESSHYLNIRINALTTEAKISDPVTVDCNAKRYRLKAGKELNCYGNYVDVISMSIQPEDFKNGSSGSYAYINN